MTKVLVKITSDLPSDLRPTRRLSSSSDDSCRKPIFFIPRSRSLSPRVPCRIEESKHTNGHVEPMYILRFHTETTAEALKNSLFSAQMHNTGRDALKDLISYKAESIFWTERIAPEQRTGGLLLSQTTDFVVLLWKYDETGNGGMFPELPLPETECEIFEIRNSAFARLRLTRRPTPYSDPVTLCEVVCRAENGKQFTGGSVRFTRTSLCWHLEKAACTDNTMCTTDVKTPPLPWRSLNTGSCVDKLHLVTFPETRVIQAQAALNRSRDACYRQRPHGSRSNSEWNTHGKPAERPITVLYNNIHEALIDINNMDAEPLEVPLSVITDVEECVVVDGIEIASDSLSSSPESSDPNSTIGNSTSSAKESQGSETECVPSPKSPPNPFRNRSLSECNLPLRGILKKRRPDMHRSYSEADPEASLDVLHGSANFTSTDSVDGACFSGSDDPEGLQSSGSRKSVKFSDKIQRFSFKSTSCILGQKKKNLRRDKNRRRRNSEGDSSHGSESEDSQMGDTSGSQSTTPDDNPSALSIFASSKAQPKFYIETIPEDRLLVTAPDIRRLSIDVYPADQSSQPQHSIDRSAENNGDNDDSGYHFDGEELITADLDDENNNENMDDVSSAAQESVSESSLTTNLTTNLSDKKSVAKRKARTDELDTKKVANSKPQQKKVNKKIEKVLGDKRYAGFEVTAFSKEKSALGNDTTKLHNNRNSSEDSAIGDTDWQSSDPQQHSPLDSVSEIGNRSRKRCDTADDELTDDEEDQPQSSKKGSKKGLKYAMKTSGNTATFGSATTVIVGGKSTPAGAGGQPKGGQPNCSAGGRQMTANREEVENSGEDDQWEEVVSRKKKLWRKKRVMTRQGSGSSNVLSDSGLDNCEDDDVTVDHQQPNAAHSGEVN